LHKPGLSVLVKSWVPNGGPYNGFLVQHSEAVTISQYFETADGKFRPSVYYCYQPTDGTLASIHELRGRELDKQTKERIVKDEIIAGMDELGVLLITKSGKSYWHGSQLDIKEARRLIPGENATSLQVVANLLGTMMWAIQNPRKGYTEPEAMDHKLFLNMLCHILDLCHLYQQIGVQKKIRTLSGQENTTRNHQTHWKISEFGIKI